jgi:hypothetical protein
MARRGRASYAVEAPIIGDLIGLELGTPTIGPGGSAVVRRWIVGLALSALIAGCGGSGPTRSFAPTATPSPASLVGVSPECAAAFLRALEGHEDAAEAFDFVANIYAALNACPTLEELESADRQLGIGHDWSYEVRSDCQFFQLPEVKDAAICRSLPEETPTPVPTPTPISSLEASNRTLCDGAQPADLYGVTDPVKAAKDLAVTDGVHLVLLEFKDLEGTIGPVPAMARGFIYDTAAPYNTEAPEIFADATGPVRMLACIALRAVEEERWGTPGQFGVVQCPCTVVDASDALVWMVDPASETLVGQPWLRRPIDVDSSPTRMILAGLDGTGLRPPEQDDVIADIETFLGL